MYGTHELGRSFIADATKLGGADDFYDFVLSSNNLKHIANPMKALSEFYRVVKKEGIIVVVVPRKYATFDHKREFDLAHLPEIIEKHGYDMDVPCGGREAFLIRAQKNFENRCLHHHVFDETCLKSMFSYFDIHVLKFAETYDNY